MPSKSRSIRVGQSVTFRLGVLDIVGKVIEDRGPIGVNGRRLIRVKLKLDPSSDEDQEIELPVDEVRPAA